MKKNSIEFAFGEILMLFRKRAHLSQTEVAKKLKVTPSTIANYESSRTELSYRKILKFRKIFGQEFEDVLQIVGNDGRFSGHIFLKTQKRQEKKQSDSELVNEPYCDK